MAKIFFSISPGGSSVFTNQNNFVRNIVIKESELPADYTEQDICDYINALPILSRMVSDTDSKTNIIIEE
jgi:hypothetical protein